MLEVFLKNLTTIFTVLFCLYFNIAQATTISTFNIRNYPKNKYNGPTTNKKLLGQILQGLKFDILSIQEILDHNDFTSLVKLYLPQYKIVYTNCGGSTNQLMAILYKPQKFTMIGYKEDLRTVSTYRPNECYSGGRPTLITEFKDNYTGKIITYISVHLKAGNRASALRKRKWQLDQITNIINELRSSGKNDIVILGDFNSADYNQSSQNNFNTFLYQNSLFDLSGPLKCSSYWWGNTPDFIESPSHLDHIVVTRSLYSQFRFNASLGAHCKQTQCVPWPLNQMPRTYQEVSDHCPVNIQF